MKMKHGISAVGYILIFLLLILDAKNAINAGAEGIVICLQTVIPSLFPFLVICPLLINRLSAYSSLHLSALTSFCGMPEGSASFLLVGLLGGYPIGAQIIEKAHAEHILSTRDAKRMLGFCNNAGPAFILGMSASLFDNAYIPFALWLIQIFSTVLVSRILPSPSDESCNTHAAAQLSIPQAISAALRNMAGICGWIIVFRILLVMLQRWVLWILPTPAQVAVSGILELSNGCIALQQIPSQSIRFIICTAFLSFGGVCVWMQTLSVTPLLRGGWFFAGRCLHLVLAVSFAITFQSFLFGDGSRPLLITAILLIICFVCVPFISKKSIAFQKKVLYNKEKSIIEVDYAISQKNSA